MRIEKNPSKISHSTGFLEKMFFWNSQKSIYSLIYEQLTQHTF